MKKINRVLQFLDHFHIRSSTVPNVLDAIPALRELCNLPLVSYYFVRLS